MIERNDTRYLKARAALQRDPDARLLRSGSTPAQLRAKADAKFAQLERPPST